MGVVFFLTLVMVGKTGAQFDADASLLCARGVAAADLRAPSAAIARVKAERQARARAEKKIDAALRILGVSEEEQGSAAKAETNSIEYGSDGSVELELKLSTKDLHLSHPGPNR